MGKLLILCESSGDLPADLAERYGITVMPMLTMLDDKVCHDNVDVTSEDVFAHYRSTGRLARTSASNMEDYLNFWNPLLAQGHSILHFALGSGVSASCRNAQLAAETLSNVRVVDTRRLSTGMALQALRAAELRDDGLSLEAIAARAEEMRDRVETSFVLDTLEYMAKGGRCSAVTAFGANLLRLKPLIEMPDGTLHAGKKYRGRMTDVLLEYAEERLKEPQNATARGRAGIDTRRCFITHSACPPDVVDAVRERVLSLVPFEEVICNVAGPTISVHCGPGTLGVLFVRKA